MMSGISNNSLNLTGTNGKTAVTHLNKADSGKGSHVGKTVRKPDQISKDGDTLELSKKTVPDSVLKGFTDARLKSMLQNKEISRQQYDKAVKQKSESENAVKIQSAD